jgi:hypothetical protein
MLWLWCWYDMMVAIVVTVGRLLSIGFILGFFYLAIMAFANIRGKVYRHSTPATTPTEFISLYGNDMTQ